MATRRRRTTGLTSAAKTKPTHEEMLEVAAERESPKEEEKAVEVFMATAAADTFEALQNAEEEKGVADFFDPGPQHEVRLPAQPTGKITETPQPKSLLSGRQPRYLLRRNRSANYRRG